MAPSSTIDGHELGGALAVAHDGLREQLRDLGDACREAPELRRALAHDLRVAGARPVATSSSASLVEVSPSTVMPLKERSAT